MTKAKFNQFMNWESELFYKDTCYHLRIAIISRIINARNISEADKSILIDQYVRNLSVNRCIIESLTQYNK